MVLRSGATLFGQSEGYCAAAVDARATDSVGGRTETFRFGVEDLHQASIIAFRNRFAAAKPNHPWIDLAGTDQLDTFGAWRTDRETGKLGLTLAGLLMFGKHQAILSPGAAPQYLVDSRDYRGRKPEERWGDRVFPDGTWEANLF